MKRRWLGTGEDMGFGVTLGWLSRQRFVTAAIAAMLVANGCGKEDPPSAGWWSQDDGGGRSGWAAAAGGDEAPLAWHWRRHGVWCDAGLAEPPALRDGSHRRDARRQWLRQGGPAMVWLVVAG